MMSVHCQSLKASHSAYKMWVSSIVLCSSSWCAWALSAVFPAPSSVVAQSSSAQFTTRSQTHSHNPETHKGNTTLQSPPLPSPSTTPHAMTATTPLALPGSPRPCPCIADASKPPHPNAFGNSGDPILEPEFNYVVYMVMEARKAGLPDDLNDFEEEAWLVWAGIWVDIRINEITNIWYRDEPKSITNILRPCEHLFMPENIEINISEIDS